jgi:4-nitrophenyl phosphatase
MQKLIILGLEGVLIRGKEVVPHAIEFVHKALSSGFAITILTNSSRSSTNELLSFLSASGFPTEKIKLVDGPQMAINRLKNDGHAKVFCLGSDSFCKQLVDAGISVSKFESHASAVIEEMELHSDITAVLVALDVTFDFAKAGLGCRYLCETNSVLYCIGGDSQIPAENSRIVAGAMTLAVPLNVSSGKQMNIIGKPEAVGEIPIHEYKEVWVIGDDLKVDIAYAKQIEARSVLVLTGITEEFDMSECKDEIKPDFVCKDLCEAFTHLL